MVVKSYFEMQKYIGISILGIKYRLACSRMVLEKRNAII